MKKDDRYNVRCIDFDGNNDILRLAVFDLEKNEMIVVNQKVSRPFSWFNIKSHLLAMMLGMDKTVEGLEVKGVEKIKEDLKEIYTEGGVPPDPLI